jgi:hypothetical protein
VTRGALGEQSLAERSQAEHGTKLVAADPPHAQGCLIVPAHIKSDSVRFGRSVVSGAIRKRSPECTLSRFPLAAYFVHSQPTKQLEGSDPFG